MHEIVYEKCNVSVFHLSSAGATYTPNEHTFAPINTAISLTIEKKEGSGPLKEPVKLGEQLLLKFRGPGITLCANLSMTKH